MEIILEEFLNTQMSEERSDLYKDCINLIKNTVNEDMEIELENLLLSVNMEDEATASSLLDSFEISLRDYLITCLEEFQVVPKDTCSLFEIYRLCEEIYNIENSDLLEDFDSIANSDINNNEKLSEILELISYSDASYWLNLLEDVGDDLIYKIKELSNDVQLEINEVTEEEIKVYKKLLAYKSYLDINEKNSIVLSNIENFTINEHLVTYLSLDDINELFNLKDKFDLSVELYALALISNDGNINPCLHIGSIIEDYIEDMQDITKINQALSKIHAGFLKVYQENRHQYE